jgi:hypothetical protein
MHRYHRVVPSGIAVRVCVCVDSFMKVYVCVVKVPFWGCWHARRHENKVCVCVWRCLSGGAGMLVGMKTKCVFACGGACGGVEPQILQSLGLAIYIYAP